MSARSEATVKRTTTRRHDMKKATKKERSVLVCTEYRGVFWGYATDTSGDTIKLRGARCALYWSADVGGFLGLADVGPTTGCRISRRGDIELRKVTCVVEATERATAAWESVCAAE
jgi:hypothetical protein